MRIVDIPEFQDKDKLLTCRKGLTVLEACQMMQKENRGENDETLIGIFSERDVLNRVVAIKKDPEKITIDEVMTKDVKTGSLTDNIPESMRRMSQGRFRHLPIVDDDNKLIGIVSQGDFVALTWYDLWHRFKQKTKTSFIGFTQVWMIVIAIILYTFAVLMLSN